MKKSGSFILMVLLLISVFSTYSWWKAEKEKKEVLAEFYWKFQTSSIELSYMGGTFEYLLRNNASYEVLLLYLDIYYFHVRNLYWTFGILAAYTNEQKFRKLNAALVDLSVALNHMRKPPGELQEDLKKNLETLKRFDDLFKELSKYNTPWEIPDELADEFFKLSEELMKNGG
ncbi:hypothetical protein [Thermococcus barophilus]|nr:hypothetical protein [Thermococcus barophilus]